ncbi:MAG: hypothetical protein AB8G22_12480 [Saprospiraceae bacterium]
MKNICYLFLIAISVLFSNCAADDLSPAAATDTGIAGSYARFLVVGDFMYIVSQSALKTFAVKNADDPQLVDDQSIGNNIETIFHYGGQLFIGSSEAMFIYTIQEDGIPNQVARTDYENFFVTPCDPIVANDKFAYVTLSTTTEVNTCRNLSLEQLNVLKIYDIENIEQPNLLAEYPMFRPKGVGLDGTTLFVCDDEQGLKIFDVSDPFAIQLITQFSDFTAFDVIPLDGLLLVVGPENIYQFDYSDLDNIERVGEIVIEP